MITILGMYFDVPTAAVEVLRRKLFVVSLKLYYIVY